MTVTFKSFGLTLNDYGQYVLTDGGRAFTNPVGGVTPTSDAHLATKAYVDAAVATPASLDTFATSSLIRDDSNLAEGDANATLDNSLNVLSGSHNTLSGSYVTLSGSYVTLSGSHVTLSGSLAAVNAQVGAQTTVLYVDINRADTYTENGSIARPYKTFAAAQTAAAAGDVLILMPGTYPMVNVTKRINILGMSRTNTLLSGTVDLQAAYDGNKSSFTSVKTTGSWTISTDGWVFKDTWHSGTGGIILSNADEVYFYDSTILVADNHAIEGKLGSSFYMHDCYCEEQIGALSNKKIIVLNAATCSVYNTRFVGRGSNTVNADAETSHFSFYNCDFERPNNDAYDIDFYAGASASVLDPHIISNCSFDRGVRFSTVPVFYPFISIDGIMVKQPGFGLTGSLNNVRFPNTRYMSYDALSSSFWEDTAQNISVRTAIDRLAHAVYYMWHDHHGSASIPS